MLFLGAGPKKGLWVYAGELMAVGEATVVRVLLVEHHTSTYPIRGALARLAGKQFILEESESLAAALERLAKGRIDVVLLDSRLPDSYWVEALAALQSRFPDVPVIILVGSGDQQRAPAALQMGAKDCIVKDKIDSHLLGRIILRHAKGT